LPVKLVWKAGGPEQSVEKLAISQDNKLLALGGGAIITIRRLGDGSIFMPLQTERGYDALPPSACGVNELAFSPDGQFLVCGGYGEADGALNEGVLKVWRSFDGQLVTRETCGEVINAVAFSPDGRWLVAGCGLGFLSSQKGGQLNLGAKRASTALGRGDAPTKAKGLLSLWRTSDWELLRTFPLEDAPVSLAFSNDGKILAVGELGGTIQLLHFPLLRPQRLLPGQGQRLSSIRFSPDGSVLACISNDGKVKLFLLFAEAPGQEAEWAAKGEKLVAFSFATNRTALVAASGQAGIKVYSVPAGQVVAHFPGTKEFFLTGAFTTDGENLIVAGRITVYSLSVRAGQTLWAIASNELQVDKLYFTPNGQALISGTFWDGVSDNSFRIKLWRASDGRFLQDICEHGGPIGSIALSPEGQLLAVASYAYRFTEQESDTLGVREETEPFAIRICRISDGETVQTLEGEAGGVTSITFVPNSEILAVAEKGARVRFWDLRAKKWLQALNLEDSSWIADFAFSPNGLICAIAAYGGPVALWNFRGGSFHRAWALEPQPIEGLSFSPDGKLIAAIASEGHVMVWDVTERSLRTILAGSRFKGRRALCFSPDSRLFAAIAGENAACKKVVKIWRVSDWSLVLSFVPDSQEEVHSLAFSPDGKYLATGLSGGWIALWSLGSLE
jgi:WD40 repeat protein